MDLTQRLTILARTGKINLENTPT